MSEQCKEFVYHRDQYRVSGGRTFDGHSTKQHFVMWYTKEQCRRKATHNGYCWQHQTPANQAALGGEGVS